MAFKRKSNKVIYQDNIITKFLIKSPKYGDFEVVIDTEDYDKVREYKWCIQFYKSKIHHIKYSKERNTILLSYLITNAHNIGYKNNNKLDNRKENFFDIEKKINKIVYQDNLITKFLIESLTYGNHEIIIDTEYYYKIKDYVWHIGFNKKEKRYSNIVASIYRKGKTSTIRLHQLIMNDKMIDHINGNIFDNRKENLRKCTSAENGKNRGKSRNNKSNYKGVSWHKALNKWRAFIFLDYKQIHLGYFDDIIEAAKAYNEAAIKYHGEFARLNVIKE